MNEELEMTTEKMLDNPAQKRVFKRLYAVDASKKIRNKNGLSYLPWSSAWAEVKKVYPTATYDIHSQMMDEFFNTRPWFDDGKTGWVKVSVTIEGLTHTETLAIMDFKNKSIPADQITSVDANKAVKRCLVKACALHGLALHIYEGEELNEELTNVLELYGDIKALIAKKCELSEKAKAKVAECCKAAEKEADPSLADDAITGNYKNIEDVEILTNLKKQLLAIRK